MANPSPGPWERRVDPTNSVIRIEEAANRGNQGLIAYVTPLTLLNIANGNIPRDDGTNFANARLIAAAPDAIHALELALEYWAHRQQRYRNRAPVWVVAARAAISKATSRQPEGER